MDTITFHYGIKRNYLFFKRVTCFYLYNGQDVKYHINIWHWPNVPDQYYIDKAKTKFDKLAQNGVLEKHAKFVISHNGHGLPKLSTVIISTVVVAAVIGLSVGLSVRFSGGELDTVTLNSKTLKINRNDTMLHRDANFTFAVDDFYANYGYTIPDHVDQVVVNGNQLDNNNYSYQNGELRIPGEFVNGPIVITAEADHVKFSEDTWENIIYFANRGLKEVYIRYGCKSVVGEEHSITIDGKEKKVRVIGEGHDYLAQPDATNKAATLTFEIVNPIASYPIAYNNEPVDAYSNSNLRNYCEEFYDSVPFLIRNQIQRVRKTTGVMDDYQVIETNDYRVFPLSYREIGGICGQYRANANFVMEESCYQYYADPYADSLIAKRKRESSYWLRTPEFESDAFYINEDGYVNVGSQTATKNVVVAFAIGKTKSFITDDWSTIIDKANAGYDTLKDYYGINSFVGLEKELILRSDASHPNDELVRVRVIGEKHDHLVDSTGLTSALTFEFVDSIAPTSFGVEGTEYSGSELRNYLNKDLYARFAPEIRVAIQKVKKDTVTKYRDGNTGLRRETTEDYLFPLSLRESGDIYYSLAEPYNGEEGSYDIFRLNIDPNQPEIGIRAIDRLRSHGKRYWLRSCPNDVNYTLEDGSILDLKTNKFFTDPANVAHYCFPAFNIGVADEEVTFSTDSWENVCYYAEYGLDTLKEVYNLRSFIGQQREITLADGSTNYLFVIGENEDTTVDGKTATLTFEFVNPIYQKTYPYTYAAKTNTPWSNSDVRKLCNNDIYSLLPSCVKESVKEVNKKTVVYQGEDQFAIETTADKLFLLSINEVMPNNDYIGQQYTQLQAEYYLQENRHYSYFIGGSDFVRTKFAGGYWLRSPALITWGGNQYPAHYVGSGGMIEHMRNSEWSYVAPAFAI